MDKAGIVNPNSKDGIDFCVEECPYPICILYDTSRGRPTSDSYKALSKKKAILAMNANGISIMDIALALGISVRTVERIIRARGE